MLGALSLREEGNSKFQDFSKGGREALPIFFDNRVWQIDVWGRGNPIEGGLTQILRITQVTLGFAPWYLKSFARSVKTKQSFGFNLNSVSF